MEENILEPIGNVRNPIAVIFLSLITCGIYYLYWLYVTGKELKNYLNEYNVSPGLDLFLCIICIPYLLYWFYKYGKLLNNAQQKVNIEVKDIDIIIYILLALFGLFIISSAIMQHKLNELWKKAATTSNN